MSESGFPSVSRQSAPASAHNARAQGVEPPNARLIGVANEERSAPRDFTARGRVVERDVQQRSVTVDTNRGEVRLEVDRSQRVPETGEEVEVTVRRDQAGQNASIRTEPQTAQLPPSQIDDAPVDAPPARTVDFNAPAPAPDVAPPPEKRIPVPQFPASDSLVRIAPITLAEFQTLQISPPVISDNAALSPILNTGALFSDTLSTQNSLTVLTPPPLNTAVIFPEPALNQTIFAAETRALPILIPPVTNAPAQNRATLSIQTDGLPPAQLTQPTQLHTVTIGRDFAANTAPAQMQLYAAPALEAFRFENTAQTQTQFLDVRITQNITSTPLIMPPNTEVSPQAIHVPSTRTQPVILSNVQAGDQAALLLGKTGQGLPVIGVFSPQVEGLQLFTVQTADAAITQGTQLQFTPQTASSAQTAGAVPAHVAMPPPVLAQLLTPASWPVMNDIQQALAQAVPQVAQAMSNMTPSPAAPSQMPPAALFFMAALRGGDLSQWLGDRAIDILRREGKGNTLNALSREGSMLARLGAEPVAQDWRAMALPLMWDGEIHKTVLHFKQEEQPGSDGQDGQKQTRFVFDLNLSAMGKVQVDSLFRPGRLDVILRTEHPLSQAMKQDMRQTYITALHSTNVSGELSFQDNPEQWVTIRAGQDNTLGVSA